MSWYYIDLFPPFLAYTYDRFGGIKADKGLSLGPSDCDYRCPCFYMSRYYIDLFPPFRDAFNSLHRNLQPARRLAFYECE